MTEHRSELGLPFLIPYDVRPPSGEWPRIQQLARRRHRRRAVLASTAVVLAAAGPIGYAVAVTDNGVDVARQTGPAAQPDLELTRNHVSGPVEYPQMPPIGGDHAPVPQTCGTYDAPVPTENAVHSMEHGAVWITYRPGLSPEGIAMLTRLVEAAAPYGLLSPLPEQTSPVAATAWGVQELVDRPDDARLQRFAETYANGPQTPEPGASCIGSSALR